MTGEQSRAGYQTRNVYFFVRQRVKLVFGMKYCQVAACNFYPYATQSSFLISIGEYLFLQRAMSIQQHQSPSFVLAPERGYCQRGSQIHRTLYLSLQNVYTYAFLSKWVTRSNRIYLVARWRHAVYPLKQSTWVQFTLRSTGGKSSSSQRRTLTWASSTTCWCPPASLQPFWPVVRILDFRLVEQVSDL